MTVSIRALAFSVMVSLGLMSAYSVVQAAEAANPTYSLDIPAGSLNDALTSLAATSNHKLLYSSDLIDGRKNAALKGAFTVEEAVKRLLSGTDLEYEVTANGLVMIRAPGFRATSVAKTTSATAVSAVGSDAKEASATSGTPNAPSGAGNNKDPRRLESERQKPLSLEEIVVTGTHIRGVGNTTSPVTVLDRNYIESTGATTAVRLMETLPQNFALANPAGVDTPGVSFNPSRGTSLNLRGVGEGTTLVLVNGRRLPLGFEGAAVDISALPLTAVERVEVLTDGASAIYGSDAVGGVVNFVLRRNFDGAETRAEAGVAPGGIAERRFGHTQGVSWSSGNLIVSGEYYHRDLLPTSKRDFVPPTVTIASLYPKDDNYSLFLAGNQQLGTNVSAFAEALYFRRDSFNRGQVDSFWNESVKSKDVQLLTTAGVEWQPADDWRIDTSGSFGTNKFDAVNSLLQDIAYVLKPNINYDTYSAEIKADGPILRLPSGIVRGAFGVQSRHEKISSRVLTNDVESFTEDADRNVESIFGELAIPLVQGLDNTGAKRLEMSLAARYDRYSKFGSSVDPRIGISWNPSGGIHFRASFGTSFVAPKLVDQLTLANSASAQWIPEPSGTSYVLVVEGVDVNSLRAQTSQNFNLGMDIKPMSGLELHANYFRIHFDRIVQAPPLSLEAFANPAQYGNLLIQDPSVSQVQDYIGIGTISGNAFYPYNPDYSLNENFTASEIDQILDRRRRNLSFVNTEGVDFSIAYESSLNDGLKINSGVDTTYLLDRKTKVSSTSSELQTLGTYSNPPRLKVRGHLGVSSASVSANLFANYTGSYTDNRSTPYVNIKSYLTLDGRVSYSVASGSLNGLTVALSAQNILNCDPPKTAALIAARDLGFDPTNANPLGRLVTIELEKRW